MAPTASVARTFRRGLSPRVTRVTDITKSPDRTSLRMVIRSRRGCAPRADSVLLACNELQPTRRRLRRIHHSSDRKSGIGEQQVTDRAHQKPPHAQACGGSKARSSRAATPRRTRPARRRGRVGAGCGNPAWRHRRRATRYRPNSATATTGSSREVELRAVDLRAHHPRRRSFAAQRRQNRADVTISAGVASRAQSRQLA